MKKHCWIPMYIFRIINVSISNQFDTYIIYIMINMIDDITNKTKTKINIINGLFLKVLMRYNK